MPFCSSCGASVTGTFCNQCGAKVGAAAAGPPPAASAAQPTQPAPSASPLSAQPMQPMQPAPPPPPYDAPPVRRKTSPIVWVLVAVLGIFVLFGIGILGMGLFVVHKARQAGIDPDLWRRNPGMAVGKMVAAVNPDVEVVRTNDSDGTITLRSRRTGKETTITFDQARQGRITFSTEDDHGKTARVEIGGAGKPPAWVPLYPGSNPTYSIQGSSDSGEEGGNYTFMTNDPASKVMEFYQDKAKELGLETKVTTNNSDGGMLIATRDGDERSLTVIVGGSASVTTVNLTYARKR